MDTRTVVKFGQAGRFHLIVAVQPGSSLVKTACGKVRDTKAHTTQGMVAEVGSSQLCTECFASQAAQVPAKPAVKLDAVAYLAETVAAAAERVGWWDSADMQRVVAAARLGAWS